MIKKPKDKRYIVSMSMRYSHELKVKAPNKLSAKILAFKRFVKKITKKDFIIYVDEDS